MRVTSTLPVPLRDLNGRTQSGWLSVLVMLVCTTVTAEPLPVTTVPFAEIAVTETISVPATVVARNASGIAAEIDARIIGIPVLVGDSVAQGDRLAQLDCRRAEATLAGARAALARTQAMEQLAAQQLERARDLQRKKSISEELLDQRRTDLAAARADTAARTGQQRLAEIDVQNCELVAPFDGIITARNGSVGSYVGRGSIIVTMTERLGSEVSAQLRPSQAASLRVAAAPVFTHDEARYPVSLRAIVEQTDPATRTREARLVFVAADALPGLAGRLSWQTGRKLLPADMITRRDGQLGVFILDGDAARFLILPEAESGRPAVVQLSAGTQIIEGGRQRLSDGDTVTLSGTVERE